MRPLVPVSSFIGRLANAIIYGILVFLLVFVIGFLVAKLFDASLGAEIEKFAAILGFLSAIAAFFTGRSGTAAL